MAYYPAAYYPDNKAHAVTPTTVTPKHPPLLERDMDKRGPSKARDRAARNAKLCGQACRSSLQTAEVFRDADNPEDREYARQREENAIVWARMAWRDGVNAYWMHATGRCRKAAPWQQAR